MSKGSLADQLAAKFNFDGTGADEVRAVRPKSADPSALRPKCGVPENTRIGDWIKLILPGKAQPRTFQPGLVFGVYRDESRHIVALDIFPSAGSNMTVYNGEFVVETDEVARRAGMKMVPSKIGTHNIFTIANRREAHGGRILPDNFKTLHMDEDFFPDLVARRCQSLLFRHDAKWFLDTDLDPMWEREGLYFHDVTLRNIRSQNRTPDTASFEDGPVCHIPAAELRHFSRPVVRRYCDFMLNLHLSTGQMHKYPEPGEWRQWQPGPSARFPVYTGGRHRGPRP